MEQPVGIGCQVIVMGYHDQRLLLFLHDPPHQLQDLHGRLGIQISCRLIRKYNPGIHRQSPRNAHSLLLSTGHGIGHVVHLFFQSHQL